MGNIFSVNIFALVIVNLLHITVGFYLRLTVFFIILFRKFKGGNRMKSNLAVQCPTIGNFALNGGAFRFLPESLLDDFSYFALRHFEQTFQNFPAGFNWSFEPLGDYLESAFCPSREAQSQNERLMQFAVDNFLFQVLLCFAECYCGGVDDLVGCDMTLDDAISELQVRLLYFEYPQH